MGEILFVRPTFRIFINTFRKLTFQKIVKLLTVTLPNPIFSGLSFYATVQSFVIARKYFPKTNSANGIGNAFRHALWTSLIMMYCCKVSSPKKSLVFCKKITDLHEELFPNDPLEKKMDLHNNQVGMDLFMKMLQGIHRQFFETSFFVEQLFEKTKTAKVIKSLEDQYFDELVYLETNL